MDPFGTQAFVLLKKLQQASGLISQKRQAAAKSLGLTGAEYAVLEHIVREGPSTVPNIARAQNVSRQHVQILSDALARKSLADFTDNPKHLRSRLLEATEDGERQFTRVAAAEGRIIQSLAESLDEKDVAKTLGVIEEICDALKRSER